MHRIGGRYDVLGSLGHGAVGAVYRVRDSNTGEELALKQLQASARSDRDEVLRFRQEFHSLSWLRHPHVIAVRDYGVDPGGPFYTMELLPGEDLRARAPVTMERACQWLYDVSSALAFLHSRRLLHRDVANRNVRCTGDERAKLIDFGCLATIGSSRRVAGTPPFLAPEALRGLPLDQRSDLFGVGALGYWLLTGRHAFGARDLTKLPALWQTTPPAPSELAPAPVPPELDALVLSLLSIDPLARPHSAAEVMDRLTAIAPLEPALEGEVARAYVQSAAMVGREAEMMILRGHLDRAISERRGSCVTIEAPSGTGKSRLLREINVEAQLAGAIVLNGVTDTGHARPYALARQLVRELLAALPERAYQAAFAHQAALAPLFPELLAQGRATAEPAAPSDPYEAHARVQTHFVRWISELAEHQPLVFLVDDLQNADEGSATLLSSLALSLRAQPILVVVTWRTDAEARSEPVLRKHATPVRLGGFSESQAAQLVRVLFGDARHLDRLARWIHERAGGLPLLCTELARQLVDRGIVRYVDGMWVIPSDLPAEGMPHRLLDAMDARIRALSDDARGVGEVLSVRGGEFPLELCARLAEVDEGRLLAALDELVVQEILVGSAEAYRFRHDGVREAFLRHLSAPRRRELHRRVGQIILESEGPEREIEAGTHLMAAGDEERAAPLLEEGGRRLYHTHAFVDAAQPLESALRVYLDQGRSFDECIDLAFQLVVIGYMCDPRLLDRYVEDTAAAAARWGGLDHAVKLRNWVGPSAAVPLGAGAAGMRWLVQRLRRRPPTPVEAIETYVLTLLYGIAGAVARHDVPTIARLLRSLEPVATLPAADVGYRLAKIMFDNMRGELASIEKEALALVERIDRHPSLERLHRDLLRAGALSFVAINWAADGHPRCLWYVERMREMQLSMFEVQALQVLGYYHLVRGEANEVQKIHQQQDAAMLRIGSTWQTLGWRASSEAVAYGQIYDALGLKRAVEELTRLASTEVYAGLRPNLHAARGEYLLVRGHVREAIGELEKALELMTPGQNVYREAASTAYADALLAAGEYGRAAEIAEGSLGAAARRMRRTSRFRAGRVRAMCELAMGDGQAAAARLDAMIVEAETIGNPATCGLLHEARAKVASALDDRRGALRSIRAAEVWFRSTDNPVLIGRVERRHRSVTSSGQISIAEIDVATVRK